MKKLLPLLLLFALVGCSKPTETPTEPTPTPTGEKPIATITMESGDVVELELYPDIAPNTVNNFIYLANSEFYDGLTFHRVISGFMIQGGDPEGNGFGGPGYMIPGEFTSNGFTNNLLHTEGVISMARSQANDSAGSQFFIMHKPSVDLDGKYAAFGKVIKGMDVIDAIASVETGQNDKPVDISKTTIKTIRVDTLGTTYPEPTKTQ